LAQPEVCITGIFCGVNWAGFEIGYYFFFIINSAERSFQPIAISLEKNQEV
jgi:hypothetical protein